LKLSVLDDDEYPILIKPSPNKNNGCEISFKILDCFLFVNNKNNNNNKQFKIDEK
jgi:hypothetical protein